MCRFFKNNTSRQSRNKLHEEGCSLYPTCTRLGKTRTGCNRGEAQKKSITNAVKFLPFSETPRRDIWACWRGKILIAGDALKKITSVAAPLGIDRGARKLDGKNFYRERAFGGLEEARVTRVWRNAHTESFRGNDYFSNESRIPRARETTRDVRLRIGILRDDARARFSEFRARGVKMLRESMKSARMSRPGCVKTSVLAAVKFYRRRRYYRLFPSEKTRLRERTWGKARSLDLYRLRETSNGPETRARLQNYLSFAQNLCHF